ncbi:MAG: hypothetical protein R3E83_05535 [Burkholderiaceae bacterium]
MLTRFDEYLIHQTPEPIAHPESMDRNHYDRYWLGGFDPGSGLYFALSFGLYPNRQVMDAAFSVVRAGEQIAFFASRRAPLERDETRVGPLTLRVLEPMRRLAIELGPNESGLQAKLCFDSLTGCIEEDRQILRHGRATFMDVTRFTQFGRWSGELHVDGDAIALDARSVYGIRDRSWGRRGVGEPDGGAPTGARQIYFVWAPLFWADSVSLAVFFQDAQGRPLHAEAKTAPLYAEASSVPGIEDPGVVWMHGVSHDIRYRSGSRWAQSASLKMMQADGSVRAVSLTPLMRHQMKATGYGHPQWRHGTWRGELATGTERWRSDDIDPARPENFHIQQLVRCESEGQIGYGVLEQLCIGPHRPSGFTAATDLAP